MCYVISCSRDVSKYIRISTTRLSVYSIQRKRKVLSCSSSARIHTQLTLCVPLEWLTRNRNQTLPLTLKNWKLTQCNKNVDKAMGLLRLADHPLFVRTFLLSKSISEHWSFVDYNRRTDEHYCSYNMLLNADLNIIDLLAMLAIFARA